MRKGTCPVEHSSQFAENEISRTLKVDHRGKGGHVENGALPRSGGPRGTDRRGRRHEGAGSRRLWYRSRRDGQSSGEIKHSALHSTAQQRARYSSVRQIWEHALDLGERGVKLHPHTSKTIILSQRQTVSRRLHDIVNRRFHVSISAFQRRGISRDWSTIL